MARKVRTACPPTIRHRIPERFIASPRFCWPPRPRPSRWRSPLLQGMVAHAMAVYGRRRVRVQSRPGPILRYREGGTAPGSLWRRHGGRDAGSAVLFEPVHRMVRRRSERHARSRPPFHRLARKVQLSTAPLFLICATSLASCALLTLPLSGIRGSSDACLQGDRACRQPFGTAVLAGPQRHHSSETDALSCGMPSAPRILSSSPGRGSPNARASRVRRLLTDTVMPPIFAKNSSASRAVQWRHHHQPELSRRPRQVVVDETQAVVDRHQRFLLAPF